MSMTAPDDAPEVRKARGAFFTPPVIAAFIANWAISSSSDMVLEPSMGDAEFLTHAVERLADLGNGEPIVWGSELHAYSAEAGIERVTEAGGKVVVEVGDFFDRPVDQRFTAVIGNPPYIRFQDFSGPERAKAQSAALRGGVALSGLASAWAAFTVASSLHLARGGRLGFVLPAELLNANYAAPVRQFLFDHFTGIELVTFTERVFAEAETEAVLLLASGYDEGTSTTMSFRQVTNADALDDLGPVLTWEPADPAGKWSGGVVSVDATAALVDAAAAGTFTALATWGSLRLGMVTGRNTYFAMTPAMVKDAGLRRSETLTLSPPGSNHLRGLTLTSADMRRLGAQGKRTRLFYPREGALSDGARAYLDAGIAKGVDNAYKCRVRRVWWQVPLLKPADLLLTYMNADTVQMVSNEAKAYHLNSVHGVYLAPENRELGRELLPLASLNSLTMLSAEITGRAYGGGVLKMEPGEAAKWLTPSPTTLAAAKPALESIRGTVADLLDAGDLTAAVSLVDEVLLVGHLSLSNQTVKAVRDARDQLADRRKARGRSVQA